MTAHPGMSFTGFMVCLSEIAIRSSLCDSVAAGGEREGEEEEESNGEEVFSLLQVFINFSYISQ